MDIEKKRIRIQSGVIELNLQGGQILGIRFFPAGCKGSLTFATYDELVTYLDAIGKEGTGTGDLKDPPTSGGIKSHE